MLTHILNISYLAVVGILGFVVIRSIYRLVFSLLAHVPGPFLTRFSFLPHKYYSLRGQRVLWIHALHQQYGPFVRVAPDEVSITDLSTTKEIHRVSTPFLKSDWYRVLTGQKIPNMFTFSDPHAHRTRRSLLASPLSENNLKKMEDTVNVNVVKAADGMAKENRETGAVDIFKWFTYMATDVIGDLTFGESFRMLDHVTPNQYYHDLKTLGISSQVRSELGNLSYLLGVFRIKPFSAVVGSVQRLQEYSTQSIARYEKLVAADPENPPETLFSKLFTKESAGQLDRADIIREGQSFIAAGSDTTAVTSTYIVYNVCKNPHVRAKLIEELKTIPDDFCWDDLRPLPYLNNVIQESLRLSGAAPAPLRRDVPSGGATLGPYALPHGTIVSTQCYTLHRDPSIYRDPEAFNPDRWINPTPEMNHAFMAFGGGTRICIGMHLARDEMRFTIANFFKRFPDVRILESDEMMEQRAYFLMGPKGERCLVSLGRDTAMSEKMSLM